MKFTAYINAEGTAKQHKSDLLVGDHVPQAVGSEDDELLRRIPWEMLELTSK